MEFEGKTFQEIPEKKEGRFEAPYEDFSWAREVVEVKFPGLAGISGGAGGEGGGESESGGAPATEIFTKLVSQYLSQSMREVKVTVKWVKGEGTQEFSVSTYWVDLNRDFQFSQ
jgi:general secretion pathway protein I